MMNYKIEQVKEANCSVYSVKEIKTDQIIRTYKVWKKAKQLMKHLNNGGGFAGWTPSFFLKKVA